METVLEQLIDVVNRKRYLLEQECDILKNILKPWTLKTTQNQVPESKLEPSKDQEEADKLSQAESQALRQVDQLLAKAEKARQLKAKRDAAIKESKDPGIPAKAKDVNYDATDSQENADNQIKTSAPPTQGNSNQVKPKKPLQKSVKPKENVNINQSQKTSSAKPIDSSGTNQSQNQKPINARSGSISSQNQKPAGVIRIGSSTSRTSVSRPSSQNSFRLPSGRGRNVPAHMTAPFKTEINTKVPQRKAQQAAKNQVKHVKATVVGSGGLHSYRTLPKIHGNEVQKSKTGTAFCNTSQSERGSSTLSHKQNGEATSRALIEEKEQIQDPGFRREDLNSPHCMVSNEAEVLQYAQEDNYNNSSNLSDSPVLEVPNTIRQQAQGPLSVETEPEVVEEVFDLRKDGSKLQIPGRFRKLALTNRALRDRCKNSRIVKKVTAEDPAQNFILKLESQAVLCPEMRARVAALTCLKRHQLLLKTFNSLHLDTISDASSSEEIYRSKVILEFLLSKFAELEEEATFLSRVHFKEIAQGKNKNVRNEKDSFLSSWLRTDGESGSLVGKEHKVQSVTDEEWLVEENLSCSAKWQHLKFTEEHLKLQMDLLDVAWSFWGGKLQEGNSDPSELQLLYGLLTTCGKMFPTFINSLDS